VRLRSGRKRGVGGIVASVFIIIILLLFITTSYLIYQDQANYIAKSLKALEGKSEVTNLNIDDVRLTATGQLNLTISNNGGYPAFIRYIGIFNNNRVGRYYNATLIGSNQLGILVNPYETLVNISTYEPLTQDLTNGVWTIQLLARGSNLILASTTYPKPSGAGWNNLPYSPRNLPLGSSAVMASTTAQSSYTPSSATNITGNYVSGNTTSLSAVDTDYYVTESIATGYTSTNYYPSNYNLISGSLVSGAVSNLNTDDQVYQIFDAAPVSRSNILYMHNESVAVYGTSYYMMKTSSSDTTGQVLSVTATASGWYLLGKFIYPLNGITLPAETWTFYYRGYESLSGWGWYSSAFAVDINIVNSTGVYNIASKVAQAAPGSSESTLSATYSFPGYSSNPGDYLEVEIYYGIRIIFGSITANAYLIIDNQSLALTDQTRLETTSSIFPTQYGVVIEYSGVSNIAENWINLTWAFDSAYNVSAVNVTLQLYDYLNSLYPTSGDGYISYISSTPNTDELQTQSITTTPDRFRDSSTGDFKLKVSAVKDTDWNQGFRAYFDFFQYTPTYYNQYTVLTEYSFSGLSSKTTIRLDYTLVINHSVSLSINIYAYNYQTAKWDRIYSGSYANVNIDETYTFSITSSPGDYILNGVSKLRVESIEVSENASSFQQRVNFLQLNQTYIESSAIYVGRGYSSEFYCFLPSTMTWVAKSNAPFTFLPGSSMTYDQANGVIYATNTTHLFEYDIQLDSWSLITVLPVNSSIGSSIEVLPSYPGIIFYAVGNGSSLFYMYNSSSGLWSQLSNIPEALSEYSVSAVSNDLIYLITGYPSDGFYAYNFTSNTWISLSYTPSSKASGLVYVNNKIYLSDVGGGLSEYDCVNGVWNPVNPKIPVSVSDYGNRLLSDSTYLYYIRFDGSREGYYIALTQLS